jgi:hypothetical protein
MTFNRNALSRTRVATHTFAHKCKSWVKNLLAYLLRKSIYDLYCLNMKLIFGQLYPCLRFVGKASQRDLAKQHCNKLYFLIKKVRGRDKVVEFRDILHTNMLS